MCLVDDDETSEHRSDEKGTDAMGMYATIRKLPETDLLRLIEQPQLVADYVRQSQPSAPFSSFLDLDLDKFWHAIHFLLTGVAEGGPAPLNFLSSNGNEIGDDVGYGPASKLHAAEVANLAAALEDLPVDVLMDRFDPAALDAAEIYPHIWNGMTEDDGTREYLAEAYDMMRTFILEAASKHEALLVSIR